MNDSRVIAEFLSELQNELRSHPRLAERIVTEAQDHLLEAAQRLQAGGLPPEEAEREAVTRFGSPEDVARQFETELTEEVLMQDRTPLAGVKTLAVFFFLMAGAQFFAGLELILRTGQLLGIVPVAVAAISGTLGIGLWKLRNWSRIGVLIWAALIAVWSFVMLLMSTSLLSLSGLSGLSRVSAAHRVLPVAGGLGGFILSVWIIWYLYRSGVKQTFDRI
jgi:hypothetical protein